VQRAEDAVALILEDVDILAREMQEKLSALAVSFDLENYVVETVNITPRRSDIYNLQLRLVWEPVLDLTAVEGE